MFITMFMYQTSVFGEEVLAVFIFPGNNVSVLFLFFLFSNYMWSYALLLLCTYFIKLIKISFCLINRNVSIME